MPWTMGAFAVGSIGLAGIPPINGFVSKWYLGLGSIQAESLIPLAVLVLSGILNAAYFFPIVHRAFFKNENNNELKGKKEASPAMVIPIVITAVLSLLFGLFPDLFFKFYRLAVSIASNILGGLPL